MQQVRKYQGQIDTYRQNRLFENNQRQFYRELDQEEETCVDDQPMMNIGSQPADHKNDTKWLQNLRSEVNDKKQKIDITTESLKKILGRMLNWKSLGPDSVQGFFFEGLVV